MGMEGRGNWGGEILLRLLSRLSSLKLTTGLLLWIAFVCIAATVIPQNLLPAPEGASLMERLQGLLSPSDLFHSFWMSIPALVLGFNLLGCMVLGLRSFLRKDSIPPMPKGSCVERILPSDTDPGQVQREIALELGRGHRVLQTVRGSSWVVFGEKSSLRTLAPVLAHGGILAILLGAALGNLGFKGSMEIPEGNDAQTVMLSGGGEMRLPFSVRCNRFSVEYYGNGMPREYRSELTFMSPGQAALGQTLMVNHPVRFGGILFSQSGFNPVLKARLGVKKGDTLYHALAEEKTYFILDEEKYQVNIIRLLQDVMHLGPAAELMVETAQGQKHLWVFKDMDRFRARFPGITERMAVFNPSSVGPYTFTLEDMTTRYSTVLSINRDPGEAFVGLGAFLFLTGIFIIFLVPAGFTWVCLDKTGTGFTIKIARVTNGKPQIPDQGILDYLQSLMGGRS
jgi:cytochrome c biogenesis protein